MFAASLLGNTDYYAIVVVISTLKIIVYAKMLFLELALVLYSAHRHG
jgi:hypothetical protein